MTFDPDVHSLSWYVRQWRFRFPRGTPEMIRENRMQILFVDQQRGLDVETMMDNARSDGFDIPEDLHIEDFVCMVLADYHGTEVVWSSLRQVWDAEPSPPPDAATPGPPYELIYADPPWPYRNLKTGGSHKSGASQHYNIMSLEDIQALPVKALADKRCALFLCATVPLLPEAVDTMAAWGFKYKTALFWHKTGRLGMGYWFRGQVEVVLLGIRGKVPSFRCQQPNIVSSRPGAHSEKPPELRDLIAGAAYPVLSGARLEMFSRDYFDGWDIFGDEVDSTIELVDGEWRRKEVDNDPI